MWLTQVGSPVGSPDLFLCDLFASAADDVKGGVRLHLESQTRMKPTKALYLEKLKKAKVANFAFEGFFVSMSPLMIFQTCFVAELFKH